MFHPLSPHTSPHFQAQRWHQSYLRAYTFTGVSHEGRDLPLQLQPFLEWANALPCVQPYSVKGGFNGVLVNWYQVRGGDGEGGASFEGQEQGERGGG